MSRATPHCPVCAGTGFIVVPPGTRGVQRCWCVLRRVQDRAYARLFCAVGATSGWTQAREARARATTRWVARLCLQRIAARNWTEDANAKRLTPECWSAPRPLPQETTR